MELKFLRDYTGMRMHFSCCLCHGSSFILSSLWNKYFWIPTVGFPGGSEVKASTRNAGDLGSIPGSGRSPGEGNDNPLQDSCLENPMDRGAWWATVHGVAKSRTRLSDFTFTLTFILIICSVRQHSIGASEKGPTPLPVHPWWSVCIFGIHTHNVYMFMHILVLGYRSNMYTLDIFIKINKNQL